METKSINKGPNNGRWNGGKSQYQDHYAFKKSRLIRLQMSDGKCEKCGMEARHVHHVDGGKSNHDVSNLLCLCLSCHHDIHSGRKNKTSKYLEKYGMNVGEIAIKLKTSGSQISKLFRSGRLDIALKTGSTKGSKSFLLYGKTMKEISESIGMTIDRCYQLHRSGTLNRFL